MTVIYFAPSKNERDKIENYHYEQIIQHLGKHGKVITHMEESSQLSDSEIYRREIVKLDGSHVLVAEITNPSTWIGFYIGKVVEWNKRVSPNDAKRILCLHNSSEEEFLGRIAGCEGLVLRKYTNLEEARTHIDDFFKDIKNKKPRNIF